MVKQRRIDSVDKAIIRQLYEGTSPMTGNAIAQKISLSAPATRTRLEKLEKDGILKRVQELGVRTFERVFEKTTQIIKAPRAILWALNIK